MSGFKNQEMERAELLQDFNKMIEQNSLGSITENFYIPEPQNIYVSL